MNPICLEPELFAAPTPPVSRPPKPAMRKEGTVWTSKAAKVMWLYEKVEPETLLVVDTPQSAYNYHTRVIQRDPGYRPEVENFAVILLNTRKRAICYQLVSTGTLDTILVHPREVFRAAIVANASTIVLAHNHPSGEATPSEADIKVTRDLIRAGQHLRIDVLDHIIMGFSKHCSLLELGYCDI